MAEQVSCFVSPSKTPLSSPVVQLHALWNECNRQEQEEFDYSPWRESLEDFLIVMMRTEFCTDVHNPGRKTKCTCMSSLDISNVEKEEVLDYLITYAKMGRDEQRALIWEWKRYSKVLDTGERGAYGGKTYLLPGTTHVICKNAIAKIIGKKCDAWSSIKGPEPSHGLKDWPSNSRMKPEVEDDLHAYFLSPQSLGAPRATRLVSSISADKEKVNTELRDADADLIELPSCHRKRALYRGFLLSQGWEAKFDHKSRQTSLVKAGEQIEDKGPISWPSFCQYWERHFPKLVIQRPAEDLCDDCVIFANKHRYMKRNTRTVEDGDSDTEEASEREVNHDEDEQVMEAQEDLIVRAAKHVAMAKEQRQLFVRKKAEAREDAIKGIPQEQRTYTFVADFAQNMYLPNFASEQPGATYYFSPLNVYPFGVVDPSGEQSQLIAHIYIEGEAKKGGNAVASMIWKTLRGKGLLNGHTAKKINVVFDQYTGQNKNHMVSLLLFFMVKLKS